jgi:glycerol uptake facilitator protein
MNPCLAELIGTAMIIVFGGGVVANVVLSRTKGSNSGWIVITWGWAIGVFVGVFCSEPYSGAHLNPAISVALAAGGKFAWGLVPGYVAAQFAGAVLGAVLVGLFYGEHFKASDDVDAKLAVFCTAPAIRSIPRAFFCEFTATFFLVFPVFLMTRGSIALPGTGGAAQTVPVGLGSLGALPVALLVLGLGLALGGTTGYAINPARDLGPRLAHQFLPLGRKRDGDWSYAWVPVFGPLAGGLAAAALALAVLAR